jgi:vacuolar-type H+-ATPase subunit H
MGWNPFKKSSWDKVGKSITDTAKKAGDTIVDTTNTVVKETEKAANTVAKTATDVVNDAGKVLNKTAGQIEAEANKAIKEINNKVLQPATQATVDAYSESAKYSNYASDEFVAGLKTAGGAIEDGAVVVGDSLVAMGEYIAEHACVICVSSVITGAFAASLNNPATEAETTAMFAPMCAATATAMAKGALQRTVIMTECNACSSFLVNMIWHIPDVRKGVGDKNKDNLIAAITFVMSQAVIKSPYAWLSPQTASIVLSGIVGYIVSNLVCTGKLPAVPK